jgi:hypothetical protein
MCKTEELSILVKVKGIPHDQQCLRDPRYKCACRFADAETRKKTLKKLRDELGLYTAFDWMDTPMVKMHEQRRQQLCEGNFPPSLIQRALSFLGLNDMISGWGRK